MKTFVIALAICAIAVLNGCKDECPSCLNGGECEDNVCNCAPGFTGDNCENAVTLSITEVNLVTVSFNNPETSTNWDEQSGPDVYFELKDGNGNVLYSHEATTYENLDAPDLPVEFNIPTPFVITNLNSHLVVSFYDRDNGEDFLDFENDFIGSVEFHIEDYIDGANAYPTEVEKDGTNLEMSIGMQWAD